MQEEFVMRKAEKELKKQLKHHQIQKKCYQYTR